MKFHVAHLLVAFNAFAVLVACVDDSPTPTIPDSRAVNVNLDSGTTTLPTAASSTPAATDSGSDSAVATDAAPPSDASFVDAPFSMAPIIDEHPQERTVVAGRSASFHVAAIGVPLNYVWERSNDFGVTWTPTGSTTDEHTIASTLVTDDRARFRVRVSNSLASLTSNAARLNVLAVGASARVFSQHGFTTVWQNAVSTQSGARYLATADLGAGSFIARSTATPGQESAYAGVQSVRFINHNAFTVTLPPGAVKVAYSGTYSHSAPAGTVAVANTSGILSAVVTPGSSFDRYASLTHSTNVSTPPAAPVQNPSQLTRGESFGAQVVIQQESPNALQAELRLGQLVIPPGESLSIGFSLTTSATDAINDFASGGGAHLTMQLPPGVHLDDTSSVPLTWVTN